MFGVLFQIMKSGIDVLVIDDGADAPQLPEQGLSIDTWDPPTLEVPGGVSERAGALALRPETGDGAEFGELEEATSATVPTMLSKVEADRDLLGEDDQAPGQLNQASSESAETVVDNAAQPSEAPDVRHGFLSLFADQIEARDPEAAAKVRELRDGGMAKEQTAERTAKAYCGSMEDLTGVQDPHSMMGGFFHDLGLLLPWGDMLKTEYDRACDAWFEAHPGMLY